MGAQRQMPKQRLETYRRRLLGKRQDLLGLVTRTEQDGRVADELGTKDLADKANNTYTKEFLFYQSSNDRSLLQLVDEALNRIEQGHYGECVHCGGPVEIKRLEAVPWARHCIPCQQKQDQGLL